MGFFINSWRPSRRIVLRCSRRWLRRPAPAVGKGPETRPLDCFILTATHAECMQRIASVAKPRACLRYRLDAEIIRRRGGPWNRGADLKPCGSGAWRATGSLQLSRNSRTF